MSKSPSLVRGFFQGFFQIRDEPTWLGKLIMAVLCLGSLMALWFAATRGATPEARLVSPTTLGSPEEVFGSLRTLWFDRALTRNLLKSLGRVLQGFGLAALVGVPLGILCGAFKRIDAFFAPISIFGRNVPVYALVPLAFMWFGSGESPKIGFIFIATVAFVLFDAARSIGGVSTDYLDTAYTLGANRWQALSKVLIPLAAPEILNSLRLLFGLAFGYIIVAEALDMDSGVGVLIMQSQRRGPREHVYLILIFITVVAFLLDRLIFALQRYLFPYRYGRG
ncbi:MAG: ABC transporter permease [Myxococcota bacterium]|jgi:NitT/TauT family transport system permease protein|nr:ABC transporter permease [Myxococcota bacterium]